ENPPAGGRPVASIEFRFKLRFTLRFDMSSIDLTRLVDFITAEGIASLYGQGLAAGHPSTPVHCSCHGLLYECCPQQVQGVLDAGATRLGMHAAGGRPGDVAGLIDHTLLKPEASQAE